MRKVINRYTIGGVIGSLLAFLYVLVSDGELASEAAHHGQHREPDRSTWVLWSACGGFAGVFAVLAAQLVTRHPKLTALCSLLAIKLFLGWIMPDLEGMDKACGGSSYDQAYRDGHAKPAGVR